MAEGDSALVHALAASLETVQRPGSELSPSLLAELGFTCARQPPGTDTCAIHCLNNLCQSPGAGKSASDLFTLAGLQEAENETRHDEVKGSFLSGDNPPVRSTSASALLVGAARTGMFDVETVKTAARAKGYEVIDIEPKPHWAEADAESYVLSARTLEESGCSDRWFLGFLVYERIPGMAMHYYAIVRSAESRPAGQRGNEVWIVLDSLDSGDSCVETSRNRLMTFEDLTTHYELNAEWFRSWSVRWYPVVARAAATATLQKTMASSTRDMLGDKGTDIESLVVSERRAEVILDSDDVRWDVALAAEELKGSINLVDRELKVLRLTVSERQARRQLERDGWNLEHAVRNHAERLLKQWRDEPAESTPDTPKVCMHNSAHTSYLALHFTDWDVRASAHLLLVMARADAARSTDSIVAIEAEQSGDSAGVPKSHTAIPAKMQGAMRALEMARWDTDRALSVLQLLQMERERIQNSDDTDATGNATSASLEECFSALDCVNFDLRHAASLLAVRRRYQGTPAALCSEALRRSDFHGETACTLLQEFENRVQDLVGRIGMHPSLEHKGEKHSSAGLAEAACMRDDEVPVVARLALNAAEWNPSVAFVTAEGYALGLVRTRRELQLLDQRQRPQAVDAIQRQTGADEVEMTAALSTIDAMDALRQANPATILTALENARMCSSEAAAALWQERVGRLPKGAARKEDSVKASAETQFRPYARPARMSTAKHSGSTKASMAAKHPLEAGLVDIERPTSAAMIPCIHRKTGKNGLGAGTKEQRRQRKHDACPSM